MPTSEDRAPKKRRQRMGAGRELQIELSQGSGVLADAMKARLLEQAQDVLDKAWVTPSRGRRNAMARRALELSEDAADAYVILAMDESVALEDKVELYRKGVEAGLRAMGSSAFTRYRGRFWYAVETRPYMAALDGLAETQWRLGQLAEAADAYGKLLKLNPDDHGGIRYVLSHVLLESGRDDDARALFSDYGGDASIEWMYGRALLAFRTHGAGETSHDALFLAFMWNPYVVRFFNGRKSLPASAPDSFLTGSMAEATSYVFDAHRSWHGTPGAVEWMVEEDSLPKPWRSGAQRRSANRR